MNSRILLVAFFISILLLATLQTISGCFTTRQLVRHKSFRDISPTGKNNGVKSSVNPSWKPPQLIHHQQCKKPGSGFGKGCEVPIRSLETLKHLAQINSIYVQQKSTQLGNQYQIMDLSGHTLWYAEEKSFLWNAILRMQYDHSRPFEIVLKNAKGETVIQLKRQRKYLLWKTQYVLVYSPPGNLVGSVEEAHVFWFPQFDVKNSEGEIVLHLKAERESFIFSLFKIFTTYNIVAPSRSDAEEAKVGWITNGWAGWLQEFLTEADNFYIKFPCKLDVDTKILLIGACILIDFMYFENTIPRTYSDDFKK